MLDVATDRRRWGTTLSSIAVRVVVGFFVVLLCEQSSLFNPAAAHAQGRRIELSPKGRDRVDRVADRALARNDRWELEARSAELDLRLKNWAEAMLHGDRAKVSSLLAARFRGTSHGEFRADSTSLSNWKSWSISARTDSDDSNVWLDKLRATFDRLGKLERIAFKIHSIQALENGELETAVRVEAVGRHDGQVRQQLEAAWRVRWIRHEGHWVIDRVLVGEASSIRMTHAPFADVTLGALGRTRAYREQLSHGTEWWWGRLDRAAGLEIYGHQGIAIADYDRDGWDDFYVAQSGGLPNRLFRNEGDGTFSDQTAAAGLDVLDSSGAPLFVDLDGDSDQDLLVPTLGTVLLFENRAGKFFRRRSQEIEARSGRASILGCAAADYDRDGDVDVYVYRNVFWSGAVSSEQSSYPVPYHDANNGAVNDLFRNDGAWTFKSVTRQSGIDQNNRRFSFAASWCDYDDDGDADLYVANDFGKNNLYRNDGGRFVDVAEQLGVEDRGTGMGVTWGDVDGDGRFDLYVANMWSAAGRRVAAQPKFIKDAWRPWYLGMARGNSLFRNLGGGRFEDISGVSGTEFGRWSWGAQFFDMENDGKRDLYVANGFVTGPVVDDL